MVLRIPARAVASAFSAALVLSLGGCGGTVEITNKSAVQIPVGTLVNPDVRIVADDGSFTLNGGQQFATPFRVNLWNDPTGSFADAKIIDGFTQAKKLGAKAVKVYVEGRARPLYGVIAFSDVWAAATGPGTRSYQLDIPKDKIANAYAGNTSVVYENVAYRQAYSDGTGNNYQFRSWVLWLSATPL